MKIKLKRNLKPLTIRLLIFSIIFYLIFPVLRWLFELAFKVKPAYSVQMLPASYFLLLAIVLFVIFNKDKLSYIKFDKTSWMKTALFSALSIVFFALSVYVKYYLIPFSNIYINISIESVFLILSAIYLGLAVFTYKYLKKIIIKFKWQTLLSLLTVFSFYVISTLMQIKWEFFSNIIVKTNYWLLSLIFPNTAYDVIGPTLSLNSFTIIVGEPCSGVTSLILFSFLFVLLYVFDWKKINKQKLIFIFTLGLIGMFLVSIFRVFLLMVIGAYVSRELALGLFHNNAGWLFFIIYFLAFTWFSYPYLVSRK